MKRAAGLTLSLLAAVSAFAAEEIRLAGIARSATSGEPLRSAVVLLQQTGENAQKRTLRTSTGPDGAFLLAGLSPGPYELTVRKSGYNEFVRTGVIAASGQPREAAYVSASLLPLGVIAGKVVDWEDEPVGKAEVRAYVLTYDAGGAALAFAGRSESDDIGEYRIFDLGAGRYVVMVSPPRASKTPAGEFYAGLPPAYYPGVSVPSQAMPIELGWGAEAARADIRLPRAPGFRVSGAVWSILDDAPCSRCSVEAMQQDGRLRVVLPQVATTSRDGRFVLTGIPSGDFLLTARQGRGSKVAQISGSIRDADANDAALVIGLNQQVSGTVVLEKAPEGIESSEWALKLAPQGLPQWWPEPDDKIGSNRRFSVADVPPARYRFELSGLPPKAYLKSLLWGGQPVANFEVSVPPSSAVVGLEAVVAFDGGSITGKLRDPAGEEHSGSARVFLFQRTADGPKFFARAEVRPDGSFEFPSVPPGSYTAYALPATSALQVADPAVQASLESFARQVTVDRNQTVSIEVALAPRTQ